MDENENVSLLDTDVESFSDIIDEDIARLWGDDSEIMSADYDEDEKQPEEQKEADPPETEPQEKDKPDDVKPEDKKQEFEADQGFTLKHLDEVKTVGRDEVVALAQKGMDYDRIKSKLSDANAAVAANSDAAIFLKELAELHGESIETIVDSTRAKLLAQKEGISEEIALDRIQQQRKNAPKETVTPKEEAPQQKTAEQLADEKRKADIAEFIAEYGPDINPKNIPQEVWDAVNKGKSLVSAYHAWEVKSLRADNAALKKEQENKQKTTGSKQTAGNKTSGDPFVDDWNSN
jgi:hypothetical protein